MTPNQKEQFEAWWYNEGSAGPNGQDIETHTKNMCEIAWSNGIYKRSAQDDIKAAVKMIGVGSVWRKIDEMMNLKNFDTVKTYDNFIVETDGSVYDEETGRYLTETELEEFVSWAERENA